jgi:acetyl esterase/lipase
MKKLRTLFLMTLLTTFALPLFAVPKIKIWKDVPSMKKNDSWITVYKASDDINTKAAVIICPGGSYHHLGLNHEGKDVALWFQSIGVNAFVLKYRVSGNGFHHPAMLEDVQRTMQLIRENANEYNIDVDKVGVIGFSAGGHLALLAAEFGEKSNELTKLGINTNVSLMPNFIMPIYPVVSMQDDIAHLWSRKSLLGKDQGQDRKDAFSMELNVTKNMPPVFLLAAKDDKTVDYRNSVRMDEALTNGNVPHKYILLEEGGHGFGMGNNDFVHSTQWNETMLKPWLEQINIIPKAKKPEVSK